MVPQNVIVLGDRSFTEITKEKQGYMREPKSCMTGVYVRRE
jgi:hypothetical protein